jgi:3-deoxy-manno-octulosonate cytidylyltransferase (CMP-KDO synthetase)
MPEAAKVLVVIPARYGAKRFPGKPLAPIAGKPMIQHVFERARKAKTVSRVVVATDDDRIRNAVQGFGGEAVMTRTDHRSGTDRISEVSAHIPADIYVNVQGDEPLVSPETIDTVVAEMVADESIQIATPCVLITEAQDIADPNVVKVVRDFEGNGMYFSRAPIPWVRDPDSGIAVSHWKHLGLYAFRHSALVEYPTLPPGELEPIEQLEQLRWLENGFRIRVVETTHDAVSVDVPADVERVEKLIREAAKPASA